MTTNTPPLAAYGLDLVDCPLCNNTGHIVTSENGILTARECDCMKERRNLRSISRSGLKDLLQRYTFGNYQTPTQENKHLLSKAEEFAKAEAGWLYLCGIPGSGKTHLCTAVCGELIERNAVRYTIWREIVPALKAVVNDSAAYAQLIAPLKAVDVLYIDDFLKGNVTSADLNIAFELLNARYNDSKKRTIISSERSLEDVLSMDEGLGSRIAERARGYILKSPSTNWRLK